MKILIAVDDSPHSERAVRFVTRMRWPAGSRMIVASAVPSLLTASLPGHAADGPAALRGLEAQRARHAAVIEHAQSVLRACGNSAEGRLLEGDAREQLLQLVEAERVDLLVLGSRGRGRLARIMLGSVSSHAVTHARCSVLVIKPTRGAEPKLQADPHPESPGKEPPCCDSSPSPSS